MADDAKIIDEAVEKFRSLMESQLARAKKSKRIKILPTIMHLIQS